MVILTNRKWCNQIRYYQTYNCRNPGLHNSHKENNVEYLKHGWFCFIFQQRISKCFIRNKTSITCEFYCKIHSLCSGHKFRIQVPYQVYMHLVKIQITVYSWYIMKHRHVRRPQLRSDLTAGMEATRRGKACTAMFILKTTSCWLDVIAGMRIIWQSFMSRATHSIVMFIALNSTNKDKGFKRMAYIYMNVHNILRCKTYLYSDNEKY